ncbi:MAG TPA: AAA family ATPase [Nitrospiraceae bacterium]|nr:MAG: AAA family ATPase [Nitrospirae bacterium GWA2_46_11]OGW22763.1 MAG: AAA family ATPase [Nitrospirae bacterium GWB2_47_37]HAK89775.1 AAA family ATPase [Nitrospiraceae bacterium]HCL82289.1 AAA family ATPase [Nitrospiraceae bacterium]HCZ11010.1 AAA family ATPase [Nitrospiraceae bacterium]
MKNLTASSIDLNPQFLHALQIMEETDKNVFITGRAGTGKSTLLQHFRNTTKKNIAVLAPTGVAAVNVKGQTVHSFFGFKPDITLDMVSGIRPRDKTIYKKLDAIVIDEVSMVRADLMDCIAGFLRIHGKNKSLPFGGIQMIFIGDLYQLPPVVTSRDKTLFEGLYKSPYFFDAMVFDIGFDMQFIELEKVYRQRDDKFLNILNAIRNNTATDDDIAAINARHMPDFHDDKGFYIYLTTTNDLADSINIRRLADLKGKEYRYHGLVEGDFNAKDLPTGLDITIKSGAQVMLLNNDSMGRWINGSIGRITGIKKSKDAPDIIRIKLQDGETVDVEPYTWGMYEFHYDKNAGTVISDVIGTFTQYPLKLAWAVTIHKGQGMTFERIIIDIGRGTFSHGQIYVALSRCTTLEGIVLKKLIAKKHIFMDWRVVDFVTKYQYKQAQKNLPPDEKLSIIEKAIKDKRPLEIVYLKTKDEKSRRTILPSFVGELEYQGRKFTGVQAFCTARKDNRVFHIERILEIKAVE